MPINSYKQDEILKEQNKSKTLFRLFSYMLKYKKTIIFVLFLMLVQVAITLLDPLFMEIAVDTYIFNKDFSGLIKLIIFAMILNTFLVIAVKSRMFIMAKIVNKVIAEIRQELYIHIQKLDFKFFDSRPAGKILARIIGDVNSLKQVLENSVTILIPDLLKIICVLTIMFVKNAKLAAASLWTVPFMIFGISFIMKKAHKQWQFFRKKNSNMNAFIHENLSGMKTVQSYNAENEMKKTFYTLSTERKDSFIGAVRWSDSFGSLIDLCWGLGTASLYFVGVKFLGVQNVTVGTYLAFGTYIGMFWQPIMNLSNFYNQLTTCVSGAERIFEIRDTQPSIKDSEDAVEMKSINGKVEFKNVHFGYEENKPVLNNVSFTVNAGETIALVGPTGAGKSTVINLLSRFYDLQNGKITVDDVDITTVTIESLRAQMGIMTQDNYLFSGTIKENIGYGKLNATQEEIEHAAKSVHAHDFIIKLEKGYDTELTSRGGGVSVGQRQLIAFARTMLSMPKILILDEATSSIDTQTEKFVQEGITLLLEGRTSFVVAHRLSTIQNADRIFVINNGGIQEQGSPAELMALKGFYYNLYMAQFEA